MKKFKLIFYPIYLIFALGLIYFSFDSFLDMEQMLIWFNETFRPAYQPYLVISLFLFLAILMVTAIIIENIQMHRINEKIPDLEAEIIRLKVKLFDQSEEDEDDEDGDDEDDED